ncbi:hypothetical protein [Rhodovarius lipocyclicus]|uniref:hypothetical protein n=1 Tax=Rhodovarius lipocyclicus TaxID=268410 RepID=UPI00135BB012|nr:hypothetical protein [Rhodovarius lipocyclicus]
MRFLAVGDSHSFFWSGRDDFSRTQSDDDRYHVFHCGPTIAYQAHKIRESLDTTVDQWLDTHRSLYSHAIFCFGEIDCRADFLKQAERQQRPVETIIEETVDRYLAVVQGINAKYDIPCLVQSPAPSPDENTHQDLAFPFVGPAAERNRCALIFDGLVAAKTAGHPSITHFTVLRDLLHENLLPRDGITYDGIHLKQTVRPMVEAALMEAVQRLAAS